MSGPSTGSGQGGFWAANEHISLFWGVYEKSEKRVRTREGENSRISNIE